MQRSTSDYYYVRYNASESKFETKLLSDESVDEDNTTISLLHHSLSHTYMQPTFPLFLNLGSHLFGGY